MSLKHGILGLLSYGPMTGYDVMKLFNESLNFFWNAQTSQIYRELGALENNGWVVSKQVVQVGKPNKNLFTISKEGNEELLRWIDGHSLDDLAKVRDDMTMRIFFSSRGNRELLVAELIEYREMNERYMHSLKLTENTLSQRAKLASNPDEKLYWLMAVKRGYFSSKANIEWVDECLEMMKGLEV